MSRSVQLYKELVPPMLIQPQLEIGKENDQYEKEANSVADKVMCMKESDNGIQCMADQNANKDSMQEGISVVQKMSEGTGNAMNASPNLENGIKSSTGNGQSLGPGDKQEMGAKIGADFNNVNIHTDDYAVQMNNEIGSKAFTHGNDIYFNQGQYNPSSTEGKHLLAHELTHTIQQGKGGIRKKIQRQGGQIINRGAGYTTIEVRIYYVPKTKENKKLPGSKSWFTEEEVNQMRTGVNAELTRQEFFDYNHYDEFHARPHIVKFNIQFIAKPTSADALLSTTYGPEGYKVNPDKSVELVPEKTPDVNTGMLLSKSKEVTKTMPDGSIGIVKGGSSTGRLNITNPADGHDVTHEIFHNLIHNHPNAPADLKNQINPADQEEGHFKAGGIFVYENAAKGRKRQNLTQQNVEDALRCLPIIADIPAPHFERKR